MFRHSTQQCWQPRTARLQRIVFAAAAAHHQNGVPRLWRSLKTQPKTTFQHISLMEGCFHTRSSQVARFRRSNRWNKRTSSSLQGSGSIKDGEWNIDIYRCRDVLISPNKLGLQDADVKRNLGLSLLWQGIPALQRAAAVPTFCPQSISRGRDALELRFGAELRLTCQGKIGSQGTEKGFATKLLDKNWTARRKRNAEQNSQKTYIASAGSTSAKRSWGPCWKFHIALGCLKLQETEFYLCFTGIRSVHDPVISWHSSTPCKIWGSNGRLDWKQWR